MTSRYGWDEDAARGCGCLIVLGSGIIALAGIALVLWVILGGRL